MMKQLFTSTHIIKNVGIYNDSNYNVNINDYSNINSVGYN